MSLRWMLRTLTVIIALGSDVCLAQRNTTCGTREPNRCEKVVLRRSDETWRVLNAGRRLQSTTHTIKVRFHSLRDTAASSKSKLTDSNINNMMSILNSAFSSTNFQFTLKEHVEHFDNTWALCSGNFKASNHNGKEWQLYVYTCDAYDNLGILGSATFPHEVANDPADDGIILVTPRHYSWDDSTRTNKEVFYTLVHEVGHWLGLLHTFSDGCEEDADNDGGSGDSVADTAAHSGASWFQSGWKECFQTENTNLNTCSDTDPTIDPGLDPVQNYMNYIHEDCMETHGEFTTGQAERMLAQWETYRDQNRVRRRRLAPGGIANGVHALESLVDGNLTQAQRRQLQERRGIQSTNDTHVYSTCLEKTMAECGCDTECITFLKKGVKLIT